MTPAVILGVVAFVTSFGAHAVTVNLPAYAAKVGSGVLMIGVLIAAYDAAELVAKPVFGALADRRGMKKTMLAGIGVFVIASLAYLVVDPRLLVVIRFAQGAGAAALSAVSLALVGVYCAQNRGRAYGIYNGIKGAGYVVGPIAGGAILLQQSFSMLFVASAGIGALAFLVSLLLPRPPAQAEAAGATARAPANLRGLWPWFAVTVINMFFVGILFGFLPVRIYGLGYGSLVNGILLTAVSASYLLVQPVAGMAADRIHPAATIRAGLLLEGACIILIPFVTGWLLFAVALLAGLGVGTVWTNTDALISRQARRGRLGMTMGVAGTFKEVGDMAGPLLIGAVSQALGLRVGFVACGALGLLALALITVPRRQIA